MYYTFYHLSPGMWVRVWKNRGVQHDFFLLSRIHVFRDSFQTLVFGPLKKPKSEYTLLNLLLLLQEILLADVGAGQWLGGQGEAIILPAWSSLTSADFSHNNIITIDESVVSLAL